MQIALANGGQVSPWAGLRKLFSGGDRKPITVLTLAEYVELVADVPCPTIQQRENFAQFLSQAHSWYKHLPRALPGAPFHIFIDKFAGCDLLVRIFRRRTIAERTEQGFHYSDIPTEEYRNNYGHLAFSRSYGTAVFQVGGGPVVLPRDHFAAVPREDGQLYGLPPEVLEAGLVHLTAAIHTLGSRHRYWDKLEAWPEESGGYDVLEKIKARCRVMQDPAFNEKPIWVDEGLVDPVLHELFAPERRRQRSLIVKAVGRVCEIISRHGVGNP